MLCFSYVFMMLEVNNLSYQYPNTNTLVLQQLNFAIQAGEVVCLLGESGSGKSTLLKLIYGLLDTTSGDVLFDGISVKGPKNQLIPGHPDMKYVAQDFDLMPYASVQENIGKFISNFDLDYKSERIADLLKALKIEDLANKKPTELSGGQLQRVAIARALAVKPQLLLLDEPFSNIDNILKEDIAQRLFAWVKRHRIGMVYSSHHALEALAFADKVLILKDGCLQQFDSPKNTYQHPKNVYIANLFNRTNAWDAQQTKLLFDLDIEDNQLLLAYPEEVSINPNSDIKVRVKQQQYLGGFYRIMALKGGIDVIFLSSSELELDALYGIDLTGFRIVFTD